MSELLGSRTLDQLLPVPHLGLHGLLRTLVDASRRKEEVKMANATVRRSLTGSSTASPDDGEEAMKLSKQVSVLVGQFNESGFIPALQKWDLQGLGKSIEDVCHDGEDHSEERGREKKKKKESP